MEKTKTIIQGVLIGLLIAVLSIGVYFVVRIYKAVAYTQADIRTIDSFLKYQVEQGKLVLPEQVK